MPRLSGSRSGRPPSSLPSAPLGAQSDPLPTDPPGTAPASRRREPAAADRHPQRGRAGRFLSACLGRAAAALLPGRGALRDAAPAGARAFPATAGRGLARPARPGARRPVFAGALAFVLLGFAALLAAPQTAHAVDKEIWSAAGTTGATTTPTTLFGITDSSPARFPDSVEGTGFNTSFSEFGTADVPTRGINGIENDNASGGTLRLGIGGVFDPANDPLNNSAFRTRLTLYVGTSSFAGANATSDTTPYTVTLVWTSSGLTWAAAQSLMLRMTLVVPGIDSIAFSSSPATGTTYDTGETVTATVTFDEAVDVTGTPQLTIDMGGSDKVLDYSSGTGTTALVFSGRVAHGDMDTDGLSIDAGELDLNGGTIKATADAHPDAVLTHTAVAASASHKVSGTTLVLVSAPTVNSIAFNSAGTDGAFKTGDAVTATVTFDESVTVDTTDGTPQLTIKMGGTDEVLDYSSGSPGTALVFSGYTVAANDEDTDGLSIEANKLDANGGTIQKTADTTVAAVLTHAAMAASANHKVDGVKPTLVTTGDDAPKTSVDGSKIILNFSENIGSVDTTKITVKLGTTTLSLVGQVTSGSRVQLTLLAADVLGTSDTNVTVALAVDAVADVPGNGIAAVSATSVIRTMAPAAPVLTAAAKNQSIELSWTLSSHGTSDITRYDYRIKSGADNYSVWTNTDTIAFSRRSNTAGSAGLTGLTNGTTYTVQVRGVNSDGEGANSNEPTATPDALPAITSVAITSTPANASTYIIGEEIEFTVTFDKDLTIGGLDTSQPPAFLAFHTDYATANPSVDPPKAECGIGTVTTTLVCTEEVVAGWYDNDGIAVGQDGLSRTAFAHVEGPLGQIADYDHSALAADSDHKVDGIRPTLSRADADPNDLTKIILTFSEAIGTIDDTKITVKKGMTDQSPSTAWRSTRRTRRRSW